MKYFYIVLTLIIISCAMASGYLPERERLQNNRSEDAELVFVKDSRFDSTSSSTYAIYKVLNNNPTKFRGLLTCVFTVLEHDTPTYVYHNVRLNAYQWKEYYASTSMSSVFGVDCVCTIEKDEE